MSLRVAIIANPRRSTGADARERSLQAALTASGAVVRLVRPELGAHISGQGSAVLSLVAGSTVPEALSWNAGPVVSELEDYGPDVVITETARALHPWLFDGPWIVVLDFVDRLSTSYIQRARIRGGLAWFGYQGLARAHRRVEKRAPSRVAHTIAAGANCAEQLGAAWIPNVVDVSPAKRSDAAKDFDVVFFGNLSYAPNIEAVEFLDEIADDLTDLDILIAGRNASPEVRAACERHDWTMLEDFESVEQLGELARVAVAPLRSAVGIQNKVLEAAAIGLPQLISPAAAAGLGPDSPIPTAELSPAFARSLRAMLLEDTTNAEEQARAFVENNFSPENVGASLMAAIGLDTRDEVLRTAA